MQQLSFDTTCKEPMNLDEEEREGWIPHRFQQRYLGTAEQQQLLPDLIRYTCGAFHPTNEMLANRDLVPRWQVCTHCNCCAKEIKKVLVYIFVF